MNNKENDEKIIKIIVSIVNGALGGIASFLPLEQPYNAIGKIIFILLLVIFNLWALNKMKKL